MRGEKIREEIVGYLEMAPLTLNEVQMVHEKTSFDGGLLAKMLTCFVQSKLGKYPPPETKEIEEYLASCGLSQQVAQIEGHIKAKQEQEREAKEAEASAKLIADAQVQREARRAAASASTTPTYASKASGTRKSKSQEHFSCAAYHIRLRHLRLGMLRNILRHKMISFCFLIPKTSLREERLEMQALELRFGKGLLRASLWVLHQNSLMYCSYSIVMECIEAHLPSFSNCVFRDANLDRFCLSISTSGKGL